MLLGLNIGKNAATPIEQATDDYLTCLDGVYPHADYVTVNISSPNTKNLRSLQSDEALDALLGAVMARREQLAQRHGKQSPVFLKIAPDLDDDQIQVIAATLLRHGCRCQRPGHPPAGRDRDQHHAQPRRRQRPAARRGNRRSFRRAGARSQQPRDPPAARRRWGKASPSSAWAASSAVPTR